MNFTAIDFETATSFRDSACAVGIVTVENGEIVDEYFTLIQPPNNKYDWRTTRVHGLTGRDTANSPTFGEVYHELKKRLENRVVVAHNESFDRSVLKKTMETYNLDYSELNLTEKWQCTLKIYKAKGFVPARLNSCCERLNIELNHHEALSDARGCALLYLKK